MLITVVAQDSLHELLQRSQLELALRLVVPMKLCLTGWIPAKELPG